MPFFVSLCLFLSLSKKNNHVFFFSSRSTSPPAKLKEEQAPHLQLLVNDLLDLVVHDEHQRAAGAAEHVGQRALEEGLGALSPEDLGPAVDRRGVDLVGGARLHHEATADGVEGVGGDAWWGLGFGFEGGRRKKEKKKKVRERENKKKVLCFRSLSLAVSLEE